ADRRRARGAGRAGGGRQSRGGHPGELHAARRNGRAAHAHAFAVGSGRRNAVLRRLLRLPEPRHAALRRGRPRSVADRKAPRSLSPARAADLVRAGSLGRRRRHAPLHWRAGARELIAAESRGGAGSRVTRTSPTAITARPTPSRAVSRSPRSSAPSKSPNTGVRK